jgi:hypothetical protein
MCGSSYILRHEQLCGFMFSTINGFMALLLWHVMNSSITRFRLSPVAEVHTQPPVVGVHTAADGSRSLVFRRV